MGEAKLKVLEKEEEKRDRDQMAEAFIVALIISGKMAPEDEIVNIGFSMADIAIERKKTFK